MHNSFRLMSLGFSSTIAERLNTKLAIQANECIEWNGATNGDPAYGHIARGNGRPNGSEAAHRVAWMLEHGAIPEGKYVRHHCANNLCCNVEHLYLSSRTREQKSTAGTITTTPLTAREVAHVRADAETVTDLDALAYVHRISPEYARILIGTTQRAA
jgi:hypothetical protein